MSDFPAARLHMPVISSFFSPEAVGTSGLVVNTSATASATWPSANLAIFVPFALAASYLVKSLWWANGTAVAGNVDCGIYSLGGALLVNAGSTVQAGTSAIQSVTLGTPILLTPGPYYMALACSSSSATIKRGAGNLNAQKILGMAQWATGGLPLGAATLASVTNAYVPLFGFTSRTLI